jgi:hypothetical protein
MEDREGKQKGVASERRRNTPLAGGSLVGCVCRCSKHENETFSFTFLRAKKGMATTREGTKARPWYEKETCILTSKLGCCQGVLV